MLAFAFELAMAVLAGVVVVAFGLLILLVKCYRKVEQGTALVRNGVGGTKVSFSGMIVIPILHRVERMDISVKRIEIYRHGGEGLICRDNIRADIKVAFFVRVNKQASEVIHVAQLLGCQRASEPRGLIELFDAKFSEALKTVGKQFDFVELYNTRERFKNEILKIIGTDLNGYVLDDAAIDYLEQTPIEQLNPDNILDADGIKKITDLTAKQQVLANSIRREREKTITKQDVEAREAILELQRQQAEAEEKQAREISEVQSRQRAEADIVGHQERKRSEQARIGADEEIFVAEENKDRQVIVARKNKERTEAVENERVERDRALEATERERIVTLAQIDKEKAVEQEKKNIQEVIRERVMVERAVVEEEEKIKDTREFAGANRLKKVAVTEAEMEAQQELVKRVQAAEAAKQAAALHADQIVIEAEAQRSAAEKETDAKKMLAEAKTAEVAAEGLAEAEVLRAKADAIEKQGTAEAKVLELKFSADAEGIKQKAEAMKLFDGVGREHEEFKLRLNKDKDVELAALRIQADIAAEQAKLVGEALKSAHIDIVGGETSFFDKIVNSISNGKAVDRLVSHSDVLSDVRRTFLNGDPDHFQSELERFVRRFGLGSDDVKNLSIAALIAKMMAMSDDDGVRGQLQQLLESVRRSNLSDALASTLNLGAQPAAKAAGRNGE
jgi:flotillin